VAATLPASAYLPLAELGGDWERGPVVLIVAILAAIALIGLLIWKPSLFARMLFWLPAHLFYRIRVIGRDHIPAKGPVLLVCNHVSFIDAILVFLAQRRPVRFVIWAPFTRVPGLRVLLHFARVIPIDSNSGPRAIVQSLRTAGEALAQGDAVCVFAEGGITRTGFLLPFHRGIEQVLKRNPAPVIPVCLDHVWGSIFSYRGGRFFWKWPQKLPYPVCISFGQPMPSTVRAVEVRQAIQKLSADSAVARRDQRRPVHRQFVRTAARHPFRRCLIDTLQNGKVYRYGTALAAARLLSNKLRPKLAKEEMVGVWLPASAGGLFTNVALALLGKVPVNLNYTLTAASNRSCVSQCRIRHIITSKLFAHKFPLDIPDVELIYVEDFRKEITDWQRRRAFLAIVFLPGFVLDRWVYRLSGHRLDDVATVIFSSGSTGEPKGVMLTHSNLAANVESVIQAIDPRPSDRILGILPFFHSFGFTVTLWVPLQVGASALYHADPRQSKEIGELCRNYQATILLITPTFLRFCIKRCDSGDFASLRILMCGAEKLPTSMAKECHEKFGIMPLEGYGCTELSPVAAANVPDWQQGSVRQVGNKPGTIGQPVPGVAARVVNPDTFVPLSAEQEGLLLIYGANVMKGYLGKQEQTAQAIRDGWYITGDMAKFDDEGFITITGRLARFSKIGGEMVPLQRIEEELQDIVGTSDRTFVVTAVPDPRRGERLVVLHTALNGVDKRQLCQQLGTRGLPNLWLPSEKDFVQVGELPLLGTGKIDLKRAKEMAMEATHAEGG
jgi:acyl-[acyl-carrier-protein]-phospholipid O-acyltransferase/long-chain-fatty-acid--[acyl-carrier-protein] ligase